MSFLRTIAVQKQEEVAFLKRRLPLSLLKELPALSGPSWEAMGQQAKREQRVGVIAEFKRSTPSHPGRNPVPLPEEKVSRYIAGGAMAISVLTEGSYFWGSGTDLMRVREKFPQVPVLRKDFLVDPYQIWEARLWGASAVLLIAELISDRLEEMVQEAYQAQVGVLVEVFDETGLKHALDLPGVPIGVNTRNLHDLSLNPKKAQALLKALPEDRFRVYESGIRSVEEGVAAFRAGADALLIGQWLMDHPEPEKAVAALSGPRAQVVGEPV